MKRNLLMSLALVVCSLMVGATVFAHHGGSDVYDYTARIEGKAVVTELVWENPHAQLFFKMKDNTGKEVTWGVELNSPGNLIRSGWTPKTFLPGNEISVIFIPSKGDAPYGACGEFVRADGRKFQNGQFCGADMSKLPVRADYAVK
jgi:hypothetical protein